MHLRIAVAAVSLVVASSSASATELPTRKAGLWDLKMAFEGRNLPAQTMQHCVDAQTDKLMNSNFGGMSKDACSKQDVKQAGGTITIDSVCKFGAATTTSHAVVTGSFDSAYTVKVTSTREGGPQAPGARPGQASTMSIEAKWLGPCKPGQKPGDIVTANGRTMNVLDMQKMRLPAGR
jgi:hypothetical protein